MKLAFPVPTSERVFTLSLHSTGTDHQFSEGTTPHCNMWAMFEAQNDACKRYAISTSGCLAHSMPGTLIAGDGGAYGRDTLGLLHAGTAKRTYDPTWDPFLIFPQKSDAPKYIGA